MPPNTVEMGSMDTNNPRRLSFEYLEETIKHLNSSYAKVKTGSIVIPEEEKQPLLQKIEKFQNGKWLQYPGKHEAFHAAMDKEEKKKLFKSLRKPPSEGCTQGCKQRAWDIWSEANRLCMDILDLQMAVEVSFL